jgi:hypothetical protein
LLIGVSVIFAAMFFACGGGGGGPGKVKDKPAIDGAGFMFAEKLIKPILKCPSTADFPFDSITYSSLPPMKDSSGKTAQAWLVKGAVDAENSFGAKVRSRWEIVVAQVDDDFIPLQAKFEGKIVFEWEGWHKWQHAEASPAPVQASKLPQVAEHLRPSDDLPKANDKEADKPSEKLRKSVPGDLMSSLDLSVERLPARFVGHDSRRIGETLWKKFAEKNEFESTQQYQARLRSEKEKPLFGDLTLNSILALTIEHESELSYDADRQICQVDVPRTFVTVHASEASRRAMEITYPYWVIPDNPGDFDIDAERLLYEVRMNADTARAAKSRLRILLCCRLVSPFVVRAYNHNECIIGGIEEIWLYNIETGEIYRKIKPFAKGERTNGQERQAATGTVTMEQSNSDDDQRAAAARARAATERARAADERARAAAEAELWRTWTDSTGQHKTEAKFGGVIAGTVKLIKRDGSAIKIPVEKLSDEDREWIEDRKK